MPHQTPTQGSPEAPAEPRPRVVDAAGKLFFIILGILAVVAGIAMGIWNPFLSNAASLQGTDIDILFGVALGVGTAIFVIVQGTLLYSIIRVLQRGDRLRVADDERVCCERVVSASHCCRHIYYVPHAFFASRKETDRL